MPADLLDLIEWPQALRYGYCRSCFLPRRLCKLIREEFAMADPCKYRNVMRALLSLSLPLPKMKGWSDITSDGVPVYWSVLQPMLLCLAVAP